MEGVFLKEFPPEADTIKNLEDAQAFLATEGAQQKFESYVKSWMKKIQVWRPSKTKESKNKLIM